MKKIILTCAALSSCIIHANTVNWNEWTLYHHESLTSECAARLTGNAAIPEVAGKRLKGNKVTITGKGIDFRKKFNLSPRAMYPALLVKQVELPQDQVVKLGCGVDWWVEGYCNGKIVYSTFGTGNISYPPASKDNIMTLPLKKGKNLIVLYLQSGNGSFLTALDVYPADTPAGTISHRVEYESVFPVRLELRNGPWLIAPDTGTVTVMFMSQSACGSAVEYRKKGADAWQSKYNICGGALRFDQTLHRIVLDHLEPGIEYEYRAVLFFDTGNKLPQKTYSFTAPSADENMAFNFFATGDTQFGITERGNYLSKYQKYINESAFHITLGDLSDIYTDFDMALFGGYFNHLTEKNYHSKPFVAVRGNHELRGKEQGRWFDLLAPDRNKGYYSFRYGPVLFIVLDTGGDEPFREQSPDTFEYMQSYMQRQQQYLQQLADSPEYAQAKYRIVLAHAAMHTQKYESLLSSTARYLMQPLQKAAKSDPAKRIHLYLTGHVHRYRRSIPGTTSVYANSPVPAEHLKSGKEWDFTILSCCGPNQAKQPINSGTLVKVNREKLEIHSFDDQNRCIDHFSIDTQGKVIEINTPDKKDFLKLYQ